MGHRNFTLLPIVLCLATIGAAQGSSLDRDEAAIAANIKALYSPENKVRAAAAKELRRIVATYPSRTTNIKSTDGGEAFWTEEVARIGPGMKKAEVSLIVPEFPDAPESSSIRSGKSHTDSYRLDHNWMVRISYLDMGLIVGRPTLIKRAYSVYVDPPANYTGTWICWHVNGQKAFEIQFKKGKYAGVFTRFHDNGQKAYEQHYVGHVADGTDTGWFPDGKLMYTGKYLNGKQDGRWVHLSERPAA